MIDKQKFIENEIISLVDRGWTIEEARRRAEENYQLLYGDPEDDEEETDSEFFDQLLYGDSEDDEEETNSEFYDGWEDYEE